MPIGFPVCIRHDDCRLKKTAVGRLKAEMNQRDALHTILVPAREGETAFSHSLSLFLVARLRWH